MINGLTDLRHPCQVLATASRCSSTAAASTALRVAFIGDGNNVANSWIDAATRFGFALRPRLPAGLRARRRDRRAARAARARRSTITARSRATRVRGADVVYTDVWTSMGQEDEAAERRARLRRLPDQRRASLRHAPSPTRVVMHCLPAHRGEEITDDVIDGPQSIVFDQAENRLHVQKARPGLAAQQMSER